MKTKGSARPSGMDAEFYRRILCSKNFSTEGMELREKSSILAKKLLTTSYHLSLLESYMASRLIPLDKSSEIRPTGFREVLREIIGKTVSWTFRILEALYKLAVGHSAGAEAVTHGTSRRGN